MILLIPDWLILIGLMIIGVLIIVLVGKVLWFILPAGIVAILVFIFTGDLMWAGIAFLGIAALSLLGKIFR